MQKYRKIEVIWCDEVEPVAESESLRLVKVGDRVGFLADEKTDLNNLYSRELRHFETLNTYITARNLVI